MCKKVTVSFSCGNIVTSWEFKNCNYYKQNGITCRTDFSTFKSTHHQMGYACGECIPNDKDILIQGRQIFFKRCDGQYKSN